MPVGVPEPGDGVTVAVKVTGWLNRLGLSDETSVVGELIAAMLKFVWALALV